MSKVNETVKTLAEQLRDEATKAATVAVNGYAPQVVNFHLNTLATTAGLLRQAVKGDAGNDLPALAASLPGLFRKFNAAQRSGNQAKSLETLAELKRTVGTLAAGCKEIQREIDAVVNPPAKRIKTLKHT